jgi:hypothetical protein
MVFSAHTKRKKDGWEVVTNATSPCKEEMSSYRSLGKAPLNNAYSSKSPT